VQLWQIADDVFLRASNRPVDSVENKALFLGGESPISEPEDKATRLWQVADKTFCLLCILEIGSHVNSMAFSPDGRLLALALGRGEVLLYQASIWQTFMPRRGKDI
jgi:WD40 repeat protein